MKKIVRKKLSGLLFGLAICCIHSTMLCSQEVEDDSNLVDFVELYDELYGADKSRCEALVENCISFVKAATETEPWKVELNNKIYFALLNLQYYTCDIMRLLHLMLNFGGDLIIPNSLEALVKVFNEYVVGTHMITLPAIRFYAENGQTSLSDILILDGIDNNKKSSGVNKYLELIKNYVDTQTIIVDSEVLFTIPSWLKIFSSRGDLVGLNRLWAMTSKEVIYKISDEDKQDILEKAIRTGNLAVVTELIARFGVANNKQLAQAIIDDFPASKESFIRKAFAQVDWGEKAPVVAEKLEDLKKYVGMKLK